MKQVVVLIGPGQIGQAIARRVGVGKHILLADRSEANAGGAADTLSNAGYETTVETVDVSSEEAVRALAEKAAGLGDVTGLIHAAGTPDEVANVAALLMGPDGGFITGSDFLMDGGVTAAYWFGELAQPSS
jgi:NAD(P)-dependent dehydrogenase (short-subunit alcohol dehydrogenase family)